MSKSNAFENDVLSLIFNGGAIAGLADNAATGALTNLYLSLHTADPGESGNQTTSEVAYTGYARVTVPRTTGGWTVASGSVSPVNVIEFGEMTAGTPSTVTHASIGTAATGTGKILYSGSLNPTIAMNVGVVPRIRQTSAIVED